MTKAGKIRIALTIAFGAFFLIVFLTFTLRPDSNRCELKQIVKTWNISIPTNKKVIYKKQTGFSLFGDGSFYTVVKTEFESEIFKEYAPLEKEEIQTIENWFSSSSLKIEEEYLWSLSNSSIGKFLQKDNAKAILLYDKEIKLLYILQSFQ